MIARAVTARTSAWLPALCASLLLLACGSSSGDGAQARAGEASAGATYGLTVSNVSQGGGAGTVTSWGNQISCGSSCFYRYPSGNVVTLTAAAASASSTFVGWGAPCNDSAPTCAVTMDQDWTVTATFAATGPTFPLTVTLSGSGVGTVRSTPGGIDCGATCAASFAQDTAVTLTAAAIGDYVFTGWSGPCSGTSAICVVTLSQATSVGATFVGGTDLSLLITPGGSGSGRIYDDTYGISCPGTCSTVLPPGTAVTLTAYAMDGSTFVGWGGACEGSSPTCVVQVAPAVLVSAGFAREGAPSYLVSVKPNGGIVAFMTSSTSLLCTSKTANCGYWYPEGTIMSLTATAPSGQVFAGWTGTCAGTTTSVCRFSVYGNYVTAPTFTTAPPSYLLTVEPNGGSLTLTTSSGSQTCPLDMASCGYRYPAGTVVTLVAGAPYGQVFAGWTGDCSGSSPVCTITMSGNRSAAPTYTTAPPSYLLSVKPNGGSVTLTDRWGTTLCGPDRTECSYWYSGGTVVTLIAQAPPGQMVAGWTGDCSGFSSACTIVMDADHSAAPTYTTAPVKYLLEVKPNGGRVTVSGSIGFLTCGPDVATCSYEVSADERIALDAWAPSGQVFAGWTGDCTGTSPTCTVTMSANRSVAASYRPVPTSTCKVTYKLNGQWPGGFSGALVIQNTGTTAWKSWTVSWTYPTPRQKITSAWNATVSQKGATVTLKSLRENGAIPAGGSYSGVGFLGTWSGSNPPPTAFSVNGSPCN